MGIYSSRRLRNERILLSAVLALLVCSPPSSVLSSACPRIASRVGHQPIKHSHHSRTNSASPVNRASIDSNRSRQHGSILIQTLSLPVSGPPLPRTLLLCSLVPLLPLDTLLMLLLSLLNRLSHLVSRPLQLPTLLPISLLPLALPLSTLIIHPLSLTTSSDPKLTPLALSTLVMAMMLMTLPLLAQAGRVRERQAMLELHLADFWISQLAFGCCA
ncbi:hypothetical protein BGZ57DRAFT_308266 [Hyaloscypha finlandica]|nr:hypothetical protein BGZ57DRAFT_308266 [Hyaloscypha finlandica]